MNIEHISLDQLTPYSNNARTHSPEQIFQIANSITEFDFTNPVLIDENNLILAGHGRLMAAQALNRETIFGIRFQMNHLAPGESFSLKLVRVSRLSRNKQQLTPLPFQVDI